MKKENLLKKVSAGLLSLCVLVGGMNAVTPVAMADGDTETSYELPNKYPVGGTKADGTYNYGFWMDTKTPWGGTSASTGVEETQPLSVLGSKYFTSVHDSYMGGGNDAYGKNYWYQLNGENKEKVYKYSNPEKRFKVGDKYFLLLDKDSDGNYFVMADDMYGTHQFLGTSRSSTESSVWFQTHLNGTWKYNSETNSNIAYWLNNSFLTDGNGKNTDGSARKLPDDIVNNLVEKDWGVEGGSNISDGYFWSAATGDKPAAAYTSIAPYTTKQKVSLLSLWEGRTYWNDISPLVYDMKPYTDKNTDEVDAYKYYSWYLRTAYNNAMMGFEPSNGVFVYSNTGILGSTAINNEFGVRPCFFLSKDFFEKVAVDYSPTKTAYVTEGDAETKAPNYVINEIKKVSFDKLVALYGQEKAVELKGDAVDSTVTLQNVYIKGQAIAGNTVSAHVIAPLGLDSVAYSWLHSDTKDGTYSVVATGDTLTLKNAHKGYMKLMAIAEKDGKYSTPKETAPFEVTALDATTFTDKNFTGDNYPTVNPEKYSFVIKPLVNGCVWSEWQVLDKVYGADGKPQLFIYSAKRPIGSKWDLTAADKDSASQEFKTTLADCYLGIKDESGNYTQKPFSSGVPANYLDSKMIEYVNEHNWLTESGHPDVLPNDYFTRTKVAPLSFWEYQKYSTKIGSTPLNADGSENDNGYGLRTPSSTNKTAVFRVRKAKDSSGNGNGARVCLWDNLIWGGVGVRLGMYIDMDYFKNGYLDTENTASTSEIYDLMKKHFTREELAGSYTLNGSESEINTIGAISEDNAPQATNLAVKSLRIDGDLIVDGTVRADYTFVGDTDGDTESGTTYQWYAMGASGVYEKIDGATGKEYKLTTKEMGREILVEVIPSNGTVSGVAATAMTDSVVKTEVFNTELNSDVSISGGKLTAKLTVQSADDVDCMAIVAFYGDDDELVDIKVQDVSLSEGYNPEVTVEHTFASTAKTYRVMLWEKTTNRPIVQGKSGSVTQSAN